MTATNVNLRKIDRLGILAWQNAMRLHEDSILLFRNQRLASAYALSVLVLEEFGKFLMVEKFLWHSRIDGRASAEDEEEFIKVTFNHRRKQSAFAWYVDGPYPRPLVRNILDGATEKSKQDAFYVGLPRRGRQVQLRAKICNPEHVTESRVRKQVTLVNDFAVLFALDILKGQLAVGIYDDLRDHGITHDLVVKLSRDWPDMKASERRRFEELLALPDEE